MILVDAERVGVKMSRRKISIRDRMQDLRRLNTFGFQESSWLEALR